MFNLVAKVNIFITLGDLQDPYLTRFAYLWVPSELVQSIFCIGGSLLDIYFY